MRDFRLASGEKIFYPLVLFVIFFGMMASENYPEIFKNYYLLILPWPTFLAMFLCALLYWYRAFLLKPFRLGGFFYSMLFQGVIFFIFSLVNVFWGIEELKKVYTGNFRGELVGIIVFYYILTRCLYKYSSKGRNLINKFGFPVPKTFQIILFGVSALLAFWPNGWELFKFGASWFIFLMSWNPYNRNIFSRHSLER